MARATTSGSYTGGTPRGLTPSFVFATSKNGVLIDAGMTLVTFTCAPSASSSMRITSVMARTPCFDAAYALWKGMACTASIDEIMIRLPPDSLR